MPNAYKPVVVKPMLKGLASETDYATQPAGTFPRGTNFLLNKRGALDTCDGTQIVHAFNNQVQVGRGKVMATFLFMPTGVPNYYLAIIKALDLPLGAPRNLGAVAAGGGSLPAGAWTYIITAIDGAGGETTGSNAVTSGTGANSKVTLTWNIVPNAQGYNVYRNGNLLYSSSLPVAQPAAGNLTVSFVDDGTSVTAGTTYPIVNATVSVDSTTITWVSSAANVLTATADFNATGTGNMDGSYDVLTVFPGTPGQVFTGNPNNLPPGTVTLAGSIVLAGVPPLADTTQQSALVKMAPIVGSPAQVPVLYNNSNIVALYPADPRPFPDGGGGGGSGGGGGTGSGGSTGGAGGSGTGSISTPSGGIQGNISFIPQFAQFTNRAIIALGNGYPPQIYADATGTPTNPTTISGIAAISVDANGVVTVQTSVPHGLSSSQVGGNVLLAFSPNPLYNFVGPTIAVPDSTHFKVLNIAAIGQAPSSGGGCYLTSIPITSTFVPGLPTWAATIAYATNSIVTPTSPNSHLYKAIQGGVSGGSQPTFPTTTGAQVADGSVIWQEAGLTNTAAPPPPGCGHLAVYAGSLWMWNTSPTNTSTGLDGPCSLRMSDVNNPNSWNPLNQAFLDKDDGTEGMGIASFTITAQGIPPEGTLVACKNFSTYQIVGVFGSPTLTIQRIKSDMGCLAPRTLQFVPGFGITRFTHLGWAVFDTVDDRVISEDIRPYIFGTNDFPELDIVTLDSNWQSVMWGFQTANPPMYCCAMPVGQSGGKLTQIACYDLVLKAWTAMIELPFAVSTAAQFRTVSANPVTILGGYSDGCISRWQAGDQLWDTGATGARNPSAVQWNVKLPEAVSQIADQKVNCRRLAIRGISTSATPVISVIPIVNGKQKPAKSYAIPVSGDWEVFVGYMLDGLRFNAIISGSGQLELDRFSFHVAQKEVGTSLVIS